MAKENKKETAIETAYDGHVSPVIGEMDLTVALIKQAIVDLGSNSQDDRQDGYDYIMSDDLDYEFSFLNSCFWCDVDPDNLREQLKKRGLI